MLHFNLLFKGKIEAKEVQAALKELGVGVDTAEAERLTKR